MTSTICALALDPSHVVFPFADPEIWCITATHLRDEILYVVGGGANWYSIRRPRYVYSHFKRQGAGPNAGAAVLTKR